MGPRGTTVRLIDHGLAGLDDRDMHGSIPQGPDQQRSRSGPGSERPRLVIADDDVRDRATLRRVLEGEQMEIISEASDGMEAVSVVLREQPDVIVLDASMPRDEGLRAASRIHASSAPTQVVLLTDRPVQEIARDAEELGVYIVIDKDADATLIVDAVKGAVAYKRSKESS